jgi:hypothetical protein
MSEAPFADHWPAPTQGPGPHGERRTIELWRVRGASDELRGLVFETSFGHALGLELDTELVLLFLQPSLDSLMAYADRVRAALQGQGWALVEDASIQRRGYAAQ